MPTYPIINKNTGEEKTLTMTIDEYEEWKKNNPDWQRNWSQGCASAISESGDWRNKVPSDFQNKINSIKKNHYGSTITGF